ncbi:MAG: EVE domain-containing protein, partial [Thermoleophilaceae bacterium]
VLDEESFVPAVELAGELEHVAKWPAEHWHLAFQGQLRSVSKRDAKLLEGRIRATAGEPAAAA